MFSISIPRTCIESTASAWAIESMVQQHSSMTFGLYFLAAVGLTIIQYLQKLRLHHACQLIELTGKGITEISYEVGYQDISAFRKVFLREFGLTPTEFRKRFSTNRVAAENESAF